MQDALDAQSAPALSDAGFCAADVAFHRALVDAGGQPGTVLPARWRG